jgi:hypothetical protein
VISEARNPAAPLPNTPGNLDVRINIEAMNRNNVRNSQFAMDQHGRVSARKRSVGMNQVKFVLSMEVSNFSDQPRKQKSAAKDSPLFPGIENTSPKSLEQLTNPRRLVPDKMAAPQITVLDTPARSSDGSTSATKQPRVLSLESG